MFSDDNASTQIRPQATISTSHPAQDQSPIQFQLQTNQPLAAPGRDWAAKRIETSNFGITTEADIVGIQDYLRREVSRDMPGDTKLRRSCPYIGVCMPPTDRIIPELKQVANRSLAPRLNTLVEQMWRGISQIAGDENCYVLQYPLPIWKGRSITPFLSDHSISGLVMMTGPEDPRPKQLAAAGVPVVLIGQFGEIPDGCGAVFALESDVANLALSHLWRLGHRRIAHIAGPAEDVDAASSVTGRQEFASQIATERMSRYASWMSLRREYDPALIFRAGSWLAGPEFARSFLQQWKRMPNAPTAVFCASDSLAVDLLDAAKAENISVPGQLSVVGVDNIRPGLRTSPALTTVELPAEDIGRAALTLLLKFIDQADCSTAIAENRTPIGFPVTKLIVRESTGPAPV